MTAPWRDERRLRRNWARSSDNVEAAVKATGCKSAAGIVLMRSGPVWRACGDRGSGYALSLASIL